MSKSAEESVNEILSKAKGKDFKVVLVLGIGDDGEARLISNCDEIEALQILSLFHSNQLIHILQEGYLGGNISRH